MASFDPLAVPPTAPEHGGLELLRAAIAEGEPRVSPRRAFNHPAAREVVIANVRIRRMLDAEWRLQRISAPQTRSAGNA
jgi:hypothetical protein